MDLNAGKSSSSARPEFSASSGPRPASSFTQSPAALQPTSLEQVQATSELCFPGTWKQLNECVLLYGLHFNCQKMCLAA